MCQIRYHISSKERVCAHMITTQKKDESSNPCLCGIASVYVNNSIFGLYEKGLSHLQLYFIIVFRRFQAWKTNPHIAITFFNFLTLALCLLIASFMSLNCWEQPNLIKWSMNINADALSFPDLLTKFSPFFSFVDTQREALLSSRNAYTHHQRLSDNNTIAKLTLRQVFVLSSWQP